MKVMCIRGAKQGDITAKGNSLRAELEIFEGEIYTVIGEDNKYNSYFLAEIDYNFSYSKLRFIPLSDIDETELVNERELTFQ